MLKNVDLVTLKSEVDKLDVDKLEKVTTGLNSLKHEVDKLDVNKLVPDSVDLSKLRKKRKNNVVKKDVYDAKIKNMKIKYLTSLT